MTNQELKQLFEQLKKEIPIGQETQVEPTNAELEQRQRATRDWLIKEQGYTAEILWPDWYPPGALPPWYQRLLDR